MCGLDLNPCPRFTRTNPVRYAYQAVQGKTSGKLNIPAVLGYRVKTTVVSPQYIALGCNLKKLETAVNLNPSLSDYYYPQNLPLDWHALHMQTIDL